MTPATLATAMARPLNSGETRDGFRFRGGHPALDFTATTLGRRTGKPRELLVTPHDFARWLCASGLAQTVSICDEESLAVARRLREAIYLLVQARLSGAKSPAAARKLINEVAATPSAPPRLDAHGAAVRTGGAAAFLSHLARLAVDLLGGEPASRIRRCEGVTCAILFLDTSRAGDRRWCSMAVCGNRAKVAEFRQRQRDGA